MLLIGSKKIHPLLNNGHNKLNFIYKLFLEDLNYFNLQFHNKYW